MNIEKILKDGDELRETFLEAQTMKQEADALYSDAHVAYSDWVTQYGAIAKAVAKTEQQQAEAEAEAEATEE